ncbi:hypothetical protein D3C71_1219060 [compost metagenome]
MRQGNQVLQRQVDQAQGGALRVHRWHKAAPDHHAVDHDFDVRQVQMCGIGMLREHGFAQSIQRKFADRFEPVQKGLPGVLIAHRHQIHQMTAVSGEIGG